MNNMRQIRRSDINKSLSLLLTIVLMAILLTSIVGISSAIKDKAQDSTAYALWEGQGSGTQDDPYLIGTKAALEKFRDITNGANGEVGNSSAWGKLTANINLAGNEDNQWTPMGHYYAFNGTLDGCGFTISGLYINKQPYDGGYGLFETIGETGVVKNLTVEGTINITCDCTQFPLELWVGGIAAKNSGRISYCTNRVNISAVYAGNYSYHARVCTGGIVGEHLGSTYQANNIRYCVNEGNIIGFRWTGGIVGKNRALIYSCCNKGNISSTQADVGGIAGQLYYGLVENCYNVGNVTYGIGTDETTRAGGIVGEIGDEAATNCYYGVVTNSFNYGSVAKSGEGTATEIGGIAGYADRDASINNTVTIKDENIEPIGLKSIKNTNTLSMYEYEPADFKTKTNFTDIGWDFFEKWKMEDNADYPVLIIGYDLYIDGELVTDKHMSGNGWTYDVGQTKLTLNNYSYKGPGYIRREYNRDASYAVFYDYMETLEINLIGTNEIINTNDSLDSVVAIRSAYCRYDEVGNSMSLGGLLKFTGNGTLIAKTNEVTGEYSNGFGINAYDSIAINGGNITAFGSAYGIMAGKLITINDGIVNATGKSGGISVMNEYPLIIGENAKSVVASGPNVAISAVIKNSVAGVGWTDELGTEGENGIAIDTTGAKHSEYKKIDFGVKYLVEFDKKGGEGGSNSARAIYGITTSSIAIPSKAGYVFDGYFDAETNGKKYYDANGASIEAWDRLEGATLYAYWEKKPEVAAVDNKIAAIGEVELTPECKQKIDEARAAYENLDPTDRPALDYYDKLLKAEEDYAALEEAQNNPTPSPGQDTTPSQVSPTPSQQGDAPTTQNEAKPEKKNNVGLVIGIIGGVAGLIIIGLLLWFFIFKKKKDDDQDDDPKGKNDTTKEDIKDEPKDEVVDNVEAAAEAEIESEKEETIEAIEAKEAAHEALTLKDSLVLAKATTSSHAFSKKYVADYLRTKDIVEVNERENYTKTGLPLADTHYVDGKDGKKCFAYVYETEGSIILLAKMNDDYAQKLQEKHSQINKSAFPKQKNTWYSLIIDDTYTKEEFEGILDELIGEVKEDAGVSLKESIALAKASTAHSFTKAYVCEYLKDRKDVELNTRENYTKTGLPLADTHYVEKDGKKICFAYVYEIEGTMILLAKMNTQYANELKKKHPQVNLSAFPKQADTWYSLIIDDTYTKEEFEKILDDISK